MLPGLLAAFLVYRLAPALPAKVVRPMQRGASLGLLQGVRRLLDRAATLNGLVTLTFTNAFPLWLVGEHGLNHSDGAASGVLFGHTFRAGDARRWAASALSSSRSALC